MKGRILTLSYGMLVLDLLFRYRQLEVLWFTSLKATVNKYVLHDSIYVNIWMDSGL